MRRLKRPVAAILLLTLMPQLGGCVLHSSRRVPLAQASPQELLVASGVVTTSGAVVIFDQAASVAVARDTLFSAVGGKPYRVALADVSAVTVGRASLVRSAGATVGVVLAIMVGGFLISCATSHNCGFYGAPPAR